MKIIIRNVTYKYVRIPYLCKFAKRNRTIFFSKFCHSYNDNLN